MKLFSFHACAVRVGYLRVVRNRVCSVCSVSVELQVSLCICMPVCLSKLLRADAVIANPMADMLTPSIEAVSLPVVLEVQDCFILVVSV